MSGDPDSILDTIRTLALDIARLSPDCADKATQIATLAGQVRTGPADRGAIQDALETKLDGDEMSDLHVRAATEAVVKAVNNEA